MEEYNMLPSMVPVEAFLKKYGFDDEKLDNKEKIKILKQILFTIGVDKDLEELKYTKNKEFETRDEYVSKINNLEVAQHQAYGYILIIKSIQKEERKLKRKQHFQKIVKVFKK